MNTPDHFDAVIVGSGFGGSVMAYRLAQAGWRVCVLERGRKYPPYSFPRELKAMSENFWRPRRGRHGLFQFLNFEHLDAVVSAGLGGGSLIFANVLIRKDKDWFIRRTVEGGDEPWPVTRADLNPHYDNVEAMLAPQAYPFDHIPYRDTPKTRALQAAATRARLEWSLPHLAVTFGQPADSPALAQPILDASGGTEGNLHKATRLTCQLCGECDIGCNYGSKNSLDYNYLTEAENEGAELRALSEVRTLAPRSDGGYVVGYVGHPAEDEGEPHRPLTIQQVTGDHLVLAAGTFGTTSLLLENRGYFPELSPRLGHYFSGNGDFLGLAHDGHEVIDGERQPLTVAASYGPVITSTVRLENEDDNPGLYVQDGGYPGFDDWMIDVGNPGSVLSRMGRFVAGSVAHGFLHRHPVPDTPLGARIADAHDSGRLLPLLGMGMDTPSGTLSLDHRGKLRLDWQAADSAAYFKRVIATMEQLTLALGADFTVDPLWYLHRVITVHPVGGCAMGATADDGVVNSFGEVFGYPGLVIADGSVMPGPVGPNPSLTIAALADRFAERLLEQRLPMAADRP